MNTKTLPVVVIGAGPVGLVAAAHLVSRGEQTLVLEAGETVGASIRRWGHVRLFSPWRYVVDSTAAAMLEAAGWQTPPADELPSGNDLIDRYLAPLAGLPQIAPTLRLNTRVRSITRLGVDKLKSEGRDEAPFMLHVERADGAEEQIVARAVIDASGTYTSPNPLGAGGLPALGEAAARDHIFYGIPDILNAQRTRYAGRRVLVAGSGHSAFNTLLDLAALAEQEPGTAITWVIRGGVAGELYGGGAADALPARGQLGQRLRRLVEDGSIRLVAAFRITALQQTEAGIVAVSESGNLPPVDEVVATTGFRPDLSLTRELRLALDATVESPLALASLIDPNAHGCGTVPPHGFQELSHPERNFYTVGMKSYGRAPTFLLLTGYEQVRSVVAALAGDLESARQVMLTLPQTGVCSGPAADDGEVQASAGASSCGTAPETAPVFVDLLSVGDGPTASVAAGCCGGPAPAASDACCARDAEAKAAGESGCGCGDQSGEALSVASSAVR